MVAAPNPSLTAMTVLRATGGVGLAATRARPVLLCDRFTPGLCSLVVARGHDEFFTAAAPLTFAAEQDEDGAVSGLRRTGRLVNSMAFMLLN